MSMIVVMTLLLLDDMQSLCFQWTMRILSICANELCSEPASLAHEMTVQWLGADVMHLSMETQKGLPLDPRLVM